MNKDTVVGILGAVILVAAMVGIFYYEGTQAPGATAAGGSGPLALTWATAAVEGPSETGSLAVGETAEFPIEITQANLTELTFTVAWTDDVAQSDPDEFRVVVHGPNNLTDEATGSGGEITVTFSPLNTVPTANRGSAADLAALAGTTGQGTWHVVVELLSAGQVGGLPIGGAPVPVSDNGNGFTLTVSGQAYEAEVGTA